MCHLCVCIRRLKWHVDRIFCFVVIFLHFSSCFFTFLHVSSFLLHFSSLFFMFLHFSSFFFAFLHFSSLFNIVETNEEKWLQNQDFFPCAICVCVSGVSDGMWIEIFVLESVILHFFSLFSSCFFIFLQFSSFSSFFFKFFIFLPVSLFF